MYTNAHSHTLKQKMKKLMNKLGKIDHQKKKKVGEPYKQTEHTHTGTHRIENLSFINRTMCDGWHMIHVKSFPLQENVCVCSFIIILNT